MKFPEEQKNENDNKKVPVGLHGARCVMVVDLGKQDETWDGVTTIKNMVLFAFEVPGYEYPVSKQYNVSWNAKSSLSIHLTSWFGNFNATDRQNFDTKDILNKECTINVGQTEGGNPKLLSILPKQAEVPEAKHPILHFEIQDYIDGNKEVFNLLPEWMRNKITQSKQIENLNSPF
tara:strand:+ start:197 stop:724 length:528 start_codon:yes stop_codon:yes gene_type:complete